MKKLIVLVFAMVLFASLAMAGDSISPSPEWWFAQAQAPAQTKEPAKPITQAEALALKIQNINLVYQSFQQAMNTISQNYPDFQGDIQAMTKSIVKRLGDEIKDLQKQLEEAKKAEPPVKK